MRVLLVVIDAASPRVVCPAIQTGRLPVLKQIAESGAMHDASVTIFPSITPAATTSIITGAYPAEHGIAGASWFEEKRNEVAYYGDDFWVIAREGFGAFFRDFLVRLNGDRLRSPTLFELIEQHGRRAACLNYLVFRGLEQHRAHVPALLALLPGVPIRETVLGPSVLSLGAFATSRTRRGRKLKGHNSALHRFGMDDASTGRLLEQFMGEGPLPDFTVAYFADNDYRSHEVGPHAALTEVESVDAMLGRAFDAAGGLDKVLQDTVVIVTSDHGHCEVLHDPSRAVIGLDRVLEGFRHAQLGAPWHGEDELMICPNMRAAQIYVKEPAAERINAVMAALLRDPRVDQVMWRSELTGGDAEALVVATSRGAIEFARGAGRRGWQTHFDAFGGEWSWRGDAGALHLEFDGRRVQSTEYPNPFERIAGALDSANSGEVWATAVPGTEFEVPGGKAHVGGASHGSLHELDSLSPLIVAGPAGSWAMPRDVRSVDVAPLVMGALGLPMRYGVGQPRTKGARKNAA